MPYTVCFHTLGCKLNFAESSALARMFEQGGIIRVDDDYSADIHVINSCSVTEHADKKCRNIVRKLHRRNPSAIIAVTGCYAQLKPYEISSIPGVSVVLSNNDKGDTYKRVVEFIERRTQTVFPCHGDLPETFFPAYSSGDRTRAFLKVQDGCDYCCAYCTIHTARGASRNIPISEIVHQAVEIARGGQKEIVITGVNTGDFGRSTGESFIDLLRALDKVDGIERYRISSIEPNLLTDEIIEFCASSHKFVHHFHIPIQSGSDKILGLMRRRYNTARYRERIDKIRSLMPDAFIGIDVMTGFPGETDEEFEKSYTFLDSIHPSFLHIFPFSERPGTPAIEMKGKVQSSVSTMRVKRLEELCTRLHYEFCSHIIGQEVPVLLESTERNSRMSGYTGNYIRVSVPFDVSMINNIVNVKITSMADNSEAFGEVVVNV